MDGDEMQTICFTFVETSVPIQGENNIFHSDLKQVVNNLVVGGERFTVSLNRSSSRFTDSVDMQSESEISIEIYPNPANERILITSDSEASQYILKIMNLSGQTVYVLNFTGEATVNTGDLKSGMYILSIMNVASGHQKIERLMIQ